MSMRPGWHDASGGSAATLTASLPFTYLFAHSPKAWYNHCVDRRRALRLTLGMTARVPHSSPIGEERPARQQAWHQREVRHDCARRRPGRLFQQQGQGSRRTTGRAESRRPGGGRRQTAQRQPEERPARGSEEPAVMKRCRPWHPPSHLSSHLQR